MAVYLLMLAGILVLFTAFSSHLLSLAVQPRWLIALSVALVVLALAWTGVIVWSFLLVRPPSTDTVGRFLTTALTLALCGLVLIPTVYAARLAYLSRDVVNTLFSSDGQAALAHDPWNGARHVNFLLLGGDAAPGRPGVRTDSVTVASVDTTSGETVLFGLPRNLQRIQLPAGPARDRFPTGFTGDGNADTPGLLNEIFQYAEDHPDLVPGVPKGKRGPTLIKQTVGDILGIPVSYYALIDMKGFAQMIDAIGGVRVTIKQPIVYGKYREGLLPAGTRKLSGEEALWFGRSRTDSDDYVRMGRQKCLLNAVAKQADPMTVLNSFERLAALTKRSISTDIPQQVLPGVVDLAQKMKGTKMRSLSFVPPLVDTANPDWRLIRRKVAEALDEQRRPTARPATANPQKPVAVQSPDQPISLDSTCG
ncbi:LCP family protein [Nonomuraea sp. B12E4]|uniref:LCP family protein n=1 Tax=Nonomuraea sp. B12E4 TaxID=3153564 RepID=UPI00325C9890